MHTSYTRIASISAFTTVITTICVHIVFVGGPTDFEERALLFNNPTYIFQRWVIVFHSILILLTMWGLFLQVYKKSLAWAGLGIAFYAGFAFAELARMMLLLYYLNGLRGRYVAETDSVIKNMLAHDINQFTLISFSLFALFMLCIALGNVAFGIAMIRSQRWTKWVGILLLIWALLNIVALVNFSIQNQFLSKLIEFTNLYFQSFVRIVLGVYLWRLGNSKYG